MKPDRRCEGQYLLPFSHSITHAPYTRRCSKLSRAKSESETPRTQPKSAGLGPVVKTCLAEMHESTSSSIRQAMTGLCGRNAVGWRLAVSHSDHNIPRVSFIEIAPSPFQAQHSPRHPEFLATPVRSQNEGPHQRPQRQDPQCKD